MSTLQRNLYEALSESVYMIQGFFDRTQESAVQLQKTVQDTDVMGLSSVYQTLTTTYLLHTDIHRRWKPSGTH